MFLRVVRATVSKGVKREYVRLVEAYRDGAGKTQHQCAEFGGWSFHCHVSPRQLITGNS